MPTTDRRYWHGRVRAETAAALACEDAHLAALHVELAIQCLRKAQRGTAAG